MSKLTSNYLNSFGRNIGIVTMEEQERLYNSTVGIAGVGAIGGSTLLSLVRMGVGNFLIADIDTFSMANLNRQLGSNHEVFGKHKTEVMFEEAKKINPEINIELYNDGINSKNVHNFVEKVDIIADCIDFFCISPRILLLEEAKNQKKPIAFAAPLAFSAAMMCFDQYSMSYNDYYDFKDNLDLPEKLVHFLVGIAPKRLHSAYMDFDKEQLLQWQTGPSLAASAHLGGSLLSAEMAIHLIGRRRMLCAPYYTQYDMLLGKFVRKKLYFGNKNPIQKLKIWIAQKKYFSDKEEF